MKNLTGNAKTGIASLRNRSNFSKSQLIAFVAIFALIGGYIILRTFAYSSLTKIWDTDADWNTGVRSNVEVVAGSGSVTLAKTSSSSNVSPVSGGTYQLVSRGSSKCLSVPNSSISDGTQLKQATCNSANNQQFKLTTSSSGSYTLTAQNSGKCVDVNAASTADGAAVIQWACHGSTNQNWSFSANSGYYALKAQHSGKCMDVYAASTADGANIVQWTCGGGTNQQWSLRSTSVSGSGGLANGNIQTFTNKNTGKCLDITGQSPNPDANVVESACDSTSNSQKWLSTAATAGYFTLKPQHSNLCMEVTSGSTVEGTQIRQWTCNGGANQQWATVTGTDVGYVLLKDLNSGKCAALNLSFNAVDKPVQLATCDTSATNQEWKINVTSSSGGSGSTSTAYAPTGSITMNFDAGAMVDWTSLTPLASLPASTAISYQLRTSSDNATWSAWSNDAAQVANSRYIQVQANLSTTNSTATPSLDRLALSYNTIDAAVPVVNLSPTNPTITAGQSTTLNWTSTNATSCSAPWTSSTAAAGAQTVSPTTTTTYNITCSGSGGSTPATTTVTVNPATSGTPVPSTIASDCSTDVTSALTSWINSVPNNSTLAFGSGKCYRIEGTVELRSRSSLTFEGNGSSFKSLNVMTTGNATDDQRAMFRIVASSNFIFRNMNIVGAYTRGGTIDETLQHSHGVDLRGTSAELAHVNISNFAGDCVYFGLGYDNVTRASGSYHDSNCSGTGRNGVSMTASNNVTVQYVNTDRIGFIAFDVEPNIGSYTSTTGWGTSNTKITNNTVGNYYLYAFAIIANAPNNGTYFDNNTITSNKGLRIGLLCNNGCIARANNVSISGNKASVATWSPAMEVVGIDILNITNNTAPMSGGAMATIDKSCRVNVTGNTYTGGTTQATITNPTTGC